VSGMAWVSSRHGSADGPLGPDSKLVVDPTRPNFESAEEGLR
jgi:hypothetical protein